MPYYIFAWISSICYALETIVGKLITKYQVSNPWLFNFFWYLFILLFTVPVALVNKAGLPQTWTDIILASVFSAGAGIVYLIALKKLDVTVITPLFNLRIVVTLLIGTIFLGEQHTTGQYGLAAVVILASFFVAADEKFTLISFFRKTTLLMVLEVILLALMSLFINRALKTSSYWDVSLWTVIIPQLLLLPSIIFFHKDLSRLRRGSLGAIALMALFGTIGTLAATKAFGDNIGLSTIIMTLPLSMVLVMLLSLVVPTLLEKHSLKVYAIRVLAASVMMAAAVKLTV